MAIINNKNVDVVVLAGGSNGLGAVRSLYKKSLSIAVICSSKSDESMKSRLPVLKYYIDLNENSLSKEEQLFSLLKNFETMNPVLIPTADWMVTALVENGEYVRKYFKTCLPDALLSAALIDKAEEVKLVEDAVLVPKTVVSLPATAEEFVSDLNLPVIIKPRSHKHYVLRAKNITVNSREEVDVFYSNFSNVLSSLIAQEMIEGPDDAQWVCNCFFDSNSELVDAFTFNRLNLSPPHFGVTSYAISEYNPEVIEYSRKLGKKIKYVGPAMVEFKKDSRDQKYKYIELNPRLGMCNYFDTSCGVNNVYYSYLLASEKQLPNPVSKMKSGVIYFDVWEDFYSRRKDGQKLSHVFKVYFSDIFKKHVFSHFAWNDQYPGIFRWYLVIRSILGLNKK